MMMMAAFKNAQAYDWPSWWLGIMRSFISGGSSSMVAAMAGMGIAPDRFNLTNGVGNTLKLMGVMFLFQGGYRMFEFLQLHGAPDKVVITEKTESTIQKVDAGIKQTSTITTTTETGSGAGTTPPSATNQPPKSS